MHLRCARILAVLCWLASFAQPASAQQTGSISGKAVDTGGAILPGVTVEARSDVLPGAARRPQRVRTASTQLPALPPGNYTVTFTLSGMQTVTRKAQVQLSQDTVVDAELGVQGVSESGHRHGVGDAHRQGVGVDQERPLERADQRVCRSRRNIAI